MRILQNKFLITTWNHQYHTCSDIITNSRITKFKYLISFLDSRQSIFTRKEVANRIFPWHSSLNTFPSRWFVFREREEPQSLASINSIIHQLQSPITSSMKPRAIDAIGHKPVDRIIRSIGPVSVHLAEVIISTQRTGPVLLDSSLDESPSSCRRCISQTGIIYRRVFLRWKD